MRDWIDLGSGTRAAFFNGPGGAPKGGMFVEHPRPDGAGLCEGHIDFLPGPWILVSESPLTLSPSLNCQACGWHHNIVGGRVQ